MARPKVSSNKKLSKRFIFRLTEDESTLLHQIAKDCGLSPAAIVREKLFAGRYPKPKIAKLDTQTFLELKKIGVNLNQLAKKVNAGVMHMAVLSSLEQLFRQQEIIINLLMNDSKSENR